MNICINCRGGDVNVVFVCGCTKSSSLKFVFEIQHPGANLVELSIEPIFLCAQFLLLWRLQQHKSLGWNCVKPGLKYSPLWVKCLPLSPENADSTTATSSDLFSYLKGKNVFKNYISNFSSISYHSPTPIQDSVV